MSSSTVVCVPSWGSKTGVQSVLLCTWKKRDNNIPTYFVVAMGYNVQYILLMHLFLFILLLLDAFLLRLQFLCAEQWYTDELKAGSMYNYNYTQEVIDSHFSRSIQLREFILSTRVTTPANTCPTPLPTPAFAPLPPPALVPPPAFVALYRRQHLSHYPCHFSRHP